MNIKNNNQKIELEEVNISEDVKQVLLGSLLGDASLEKTSKNASYSCSHSPKQKRYIFWKSKILSKGFKVHLKLYNNRKGFIFKTYRLSTNCSPILTEIHPLYYTKSVKPKRRWEKIVNPKILEQLEPLGIAIWYGDDGTYYIRDKSCSLSTQGFTYEENLLIKDYFYNKWNIKVKIIRDYNKQYNKN